jgi:CRISPR-associated endonuclease/helicase Cas3
LPVTEEQFRSVFIALTGNKNGHFPWQWALYQEFATGRFLRSCNLPTGLGKTSVIALWLIALANHCDKLPRRLVYVVNRRTVVDQTTTEVEKLRGNLQTAGLFGPLEQLCAIPLDKDEPPLAISTLRGQFADNREWSADPARPAVIAGTVDMIGSRLLFSGYGVGFKGNPLHAGFLGQDVLLVHDEAHLEPAFQKLIETIQREQRECERIRELPWRKLLVMALTATARSGDPNMNDVLGLTHEEKNPPPEIPDPPTEPLHVVWQRLKAQKHLALTPVEDDKQVPGKVAEIAAGYKDANATVLVFVRTLDAVSSIEKELDKTGRKVVTLTGTMRGKQRDELLRNPEFRRFFKGAEPSKTVYLVCTSAGEVGIDISADHMVCDLSTFDSMAQRLGRVHRFGEPIAHVARIDVVHPASFGKIDKKTGELKADEIDKRRSKTLELLRKVPETGRQIETREPIFDASPKALGDLWQRSDLPCRIEDTFAPPPTIVPATDMLFDAWALTTIRDKLPGRPEVAPYVHGIAHDLPQTMIAWRAELDLLKDDPDPRSKLRAIFSKHRIRPHESLTVNSYQAVRFLKEITAAKARPDLLDTRLALIFVRNLDLTTVRALINNPGPLNADPMLVLPATFGGLDHKGMLSAAKANNKKPAGSQDDAADAAPMSTLDVADAEGYERHKDANPRVRILLERSEEGWCLSSLPGGKPLRADWQLKGSYDKTTQLIHHIRTQSGLKLRLVQPVAFNEEGDPVRSLLCLSPPPREGNLAIEQTLETHVDQVEKQAASLVAALLSGDKVAKAALLFAAKWHDEGKKAKRWQRYIGRRDDNDPPLGKSAEWRDPKMLAGYRHEFGSLLRIPNDEVRRFFADPQGGLTTDQQKEAHELALHLIASHHGYARPHFDNPRDPEFTDLQCEAVHIESIQRYVRLQRRYGRWGLAYLESLLRAADAAASRTVGVDPETDDDDTDSIPGGDA